MTGRHMAVHAGAPEIDAGRMNALVDRLLNRHAVVGLALGIVRNGSLEFFRGHGLADIASRTPITEDTVFRIGSITKTFTAIAVMQLWERGLLDLDAPANDYLRAFKLVPVKASFRPSTPRDLLTHTAGLPQVPHPWRALRSAFGTAQASIELAETFEFGQRLPTLAEFYGGALAVVVEPGTRFTYSDHNFAVLGQMVEDVSGESLDRYFRDHVFDPLGMTCTDLRRSEQVMSRLATGYELGPKGPKPVADREWVTAAAGSVYSTPRDMARYVAALVGGGANEHGPILKPATLRTMFEPQYQTDPRVPGVGLAFFRAELGRHLAIEHEGLLPGFNSQIFVAPDDGLGVIAFSNGAAGAMMWLPAETAGMLKSMLGVPDDVMRSDVPQHPEIWHEICGWYPVSARLTDTQARAIGGLGVEVFVRGGRLILRSVSPIPAMYRGFALQPDDENDPYVFRIDLSKFGVGLARVVFSRDPYGGRTGLHADFIPLSLRKDPAGRRRRWPRFAAAGALALGTTAIVLRRARTRSGRAG